MKLNIMLFFVLIFKYANSILPKFRGHLNKDFLQLLFYSVDFDKSDKIDLYKGNIETIDQFTFKGYNLNFYIIPIVKKILIDYLKVFKIYKDYLLTIIN
jgi:hypothetical protein